VLDLAMPKLPGLEALRELTEEVGSLRPVVLTGGVTSRQILKALQLGARGVVLKEDVTGGLLDALRTIVDGRCWVGGKPVANLMQAITALMADSGPPPNTFGLTAREFEMVAAVVEGCSNKEIARRHSISEETVKTAPHQRVRQDRRVVAAGAGDVRRAPPPDCVPRVA
jgi:DNA-binding NarL/FixJ family response regulator